jgi:hypothetical protein
MSMPRAWSFSVCTPVCIAVWLAICTAILAALTPARADAATAYVTDELVLGVFTEQNGQGQRLATLHSGATLDTIAVSGEFTQVRLGDGTVGWVKSTYLTTREPAAARLKELEEELERNHTTTPELAEAAAAIDSTPTTSIASAAAAPRDPDSSSDGASHPAAEAAPPAAWRRFAPLIAAVIVSLAAGFWMGHAMLARRIRRKFGGIKVY